MDYLDQLYGGTEETAPVAPKSEPEVTRAPVEAAPAQDYLDELYGNSDVTPAPAAPAAPAAAPSSTFSQRMDRFGADVSEAGGILQKGVGALASSAGSAADYLNQPLWGDVEARDPTRMSAKLKSWGDDFQKAGEARYGERTKALSKQTLADAWKAGNTIDYLALRSMESLPTTIASLAVGAGAGMALRVGAGAAGLAAEALPAVAGTGAFSGATGTAAALGMGDTYQQIADGINGTDAQTLAANSALFKADIEAGKSEQEAKDELIRDAGWWQPMAVGVVTGLTSKFGIEEVLAKRMAGELITKGFVQGALKPFLTGAAGEGLQEFLESGAQELAAQDALVRSGQQKDYDWSKVGAAASEGAVVGAASGGVLAPALHPSGHEAPGDTPPPTTTGDKTQSTDQKHEGEAGSEPIQEVGKATPGSTSATAPAPPPDRADKAVSRGVAAGVFTVHGKVDSDAAVALGVAEDDETDIDEATAPEEDDEEGLAQRAALEAAVREPPGDKDLQAAMAPAVGPTPSTTNTRTVETITNEALAQAQSAVAPVAPEAVAPPQAAAPEAMPPQAIPEPAQPLPPQAPQAEALPPQALPQEAAAPQAMTAPAPVVEAARTPQAVEEAPAAGADGLPPVAPTTVEETSEPFDDELFNRLMGKEAATPGVSPAVEAAPATVPAAKAKVLKLKRRKELLVNRAATEVDPSTVEHRTKPNVEGRSRSAAVKGLLAGELRAQLAEEDIKGTHADAAIEEALNHFADEADSSQHDSISAAARTLREPIYQRAKKEALRREAEANEAATVGRAEGTLSGIKRARVVEDQRRAGEKEVGGSGQTKGRAGKHKKKSALEMRREDAETFERRHAAVVAREGDAAPELSKEVVAAVKSRPSRGGNVAKHTVKGLARANVKAKLEALREREIAEQEALEAPAREAEAAREAREREEIIATEKQTPAERAAATHKARVKRDHTVHDQHLADAIAANPEPDSKATTTRDFMNGLRTHLIGFVNDLKQRIGNLPETRDETASKAQNFLVKVRAITRQNSKRNGQLSDDALYDIFFLKQQMERMTAEEFHQELAGMDMESDHYQEYKPETTGVESEDLDRTPGQITGGEIASRSGEYPTTEADMFREIFGVDYSPRPTQPSAENHALEAYNTFISGRGERVIVTKENRSRLGKAIKDFPHPIMPGMKPGGLYGEFLRRVDARIMEFLKDVPVYWVDKGEMAALSDIPAGGMWLEPSQSQRARGAKGSMILRKDMDPTTIAKVLRHEAVHGMTVYAIMENIDGIGDIANEIIAQLKQDFPEVNHYGMLNAYELLAEAFTNPNFQNFLGRTQMPQAIADRIAGMGKTASYWDAFVALVQKAMRFASMGRVGNTYLDAVMRLAEPGFRGDDSLRDDAIIGLFADADNARQMRASHTIDTGRGRQQPSHPQEMIASRIPTPQGVQDQADAYGADVLRRSGLSGVGHTLRVGIDKLKTATQIAQDTVKWLGREHNPFFDVVDAMRKSPAIARELMENGDKLVARFLDRKLMSESQSGQVQDLMHRSTVFNVDPSKDLAGNKHIQAKDKKSYKHRQAKAMHAKLRADYEKMTPAQQALFRDAGQFYKDFQNRMGAETISSMLTEAQNRGVFPDLPKGKTRADLEKWVLSGGLRNASFDAIARGKAELKAKAEGTPYVAADLTENEQYAKALGSYGEVLREATGLLMKDGFYAPLVRNGKHMVSARLKMPTADGAKVAGDQMIFDDLKKLQAFLETHEGTMAKAPFSYWYDTATGKQVPRPPKPASPPKGVKQAFVVTPQLQSFEAFDSHKEAVQRRDQLRKDPAYETVHDKTLRSATFEHSNREIMPKTGQKLIEAAVRGIENETLRNQIRHSIGSAVLQSMAGTRIQQRRLKRRAVVGFNKDAARAMADYNVSASNHIAKLQMAPAINHGMLAIAKAVREREQRHYDGSGQRMRELHAALENHITKNNQYDPASGLSRVANVATTVSYLNHLASTSTMLINTFQPGMVTLPRLAAHHKGSAVAAMNRAYGKVGRARMFKGAFVGVGKASKSFFTGETLHNDYAEKLKARLTSADERDLIDQLSGLDGLLTSIQGQEVATSEMRKNVFERYLGRGAEIVSQANAAIEFTNRAVTALASYELARKDGKTHQQAVDYAGDMINDTQGDYSREVAPPLFKSQYGRIIFQFKKYPQMMLRLLLRDAKRGFFESGLTPQERKSARKSLAYTAVSHSMMAGLAGGIPFLEGAKLIALLAQALGLTDDDWEDAENKVQAMFNALIGDKMSEALMHGLPRLIGADVSSRVGLDSLLTFGSPKDPTKDEDLKAWLWDLSVGAPVGLITNAIKGIREGDVTKLPVPKQFIDIGKGVAGYGTKKVSAKGRPIAGSELSLSDAIWQAFGFTPAKRAEAFEPGGSGYKVQQEKKAKDARSAAMQPWLAADTAAEQQAAWKDVQEFNRSHPAAERITRADLLRNKQRRAREDRKALHGAQ